MGNAKAIYPSLNGKNSACVIDDDKVQILTWNSHHTGSFIDYLGNAKAIYPSLSGKNMSVTE